MDYVTLRDDGMTLDVPPCYRTLGVFHDHLANTVWFRLPKNPTAKVDLTNSNIYINFTNARKVTSRQTISTWMMDDDQEHIVFAWDMDNRVFVVDGEIKYVVCATSKDGSATIYEWNSAAVRAKVLEGCELGPGPEEVPMDLAVLLTDSESARQSLQSVIDDSVVKAATLEDCIGTLEELTGAEEIILRLRNVEAALLNHAEPSYALIDAENTMIQVSDGYVLGAEDRLPWYQMMDDAMAANDYLYKMLEASRTRIKSLETQMASIAQSTAYLLEMAGVLEGKDLMEVN